MKDTNSLPELPGSPHAAKGVWKVAGLQLAGLLCTIGQMVVIGAVVDRVSAGSESVLPWLGGFLVLVGVRAGLTGAARVAGHHVAAEAKEATRVGLLRQMIRLGPQRGEEGTGRLVFQAVEGVEALDVYYGLFRPQMIVGLATPLLICAVVAAMDWMTGLVLLVAAPLAPLLMGMLQKRFRQVSSRYYARAGQLSAQFLDSVQGLPVLKMFNRGRAQGQEIFRIGEMLRRETMRLLAVNQLAIFLMDWGFALGVTTVAFVMAALRWKAGALSLGEGVAVILLSVEVIRQLNLLGAFFFAGAAGRTMIKAIREYLGRKPAVNPGNTMPGLLTSSPARPPSIRFEHVTFAYDRDGVVLDDVHFTIGSGKTVALTGASGAGKSSLVHLLLRFADPQRGRILLDGRPLTEYPLSWLRSQMAVVAQDTWLFHGTIADNLRIARPRATLEEMETAARAAGLQDFIVSLPRGYDTPLGERGARLSGGQAQRLAIARAILKDAPILILDEPTSHLDSRTEETVLAELDRLSRGKTVLHITHRLHTIRNADRLVVLREGGFRPKETPVAT